MPRKMNFSDQVKIGANISRPSALALRVASAQTGQTTGIILDRLVQGFLQQLLGTGTSNQVGGDHPVPQKPPAPVLTTPPRKEYQPGLLGGGNPAMAMVNAQKAAQRAKNGKPAGQPDPGSTPWTPDSLLDVLKQLGRERPALAAALGLKNIHIWWSPGKGSTPSIPPGRWGQIDQVLQGWGWVKP